MAKSKITVEIGANIDGLDEMKKLLDIANLQIKQLEATIEAIENVRIQASLQLVPAQQ